jgi:hypothetical protein
VDTSDFKILRGVRLLQWIEDEDTLEERSNYDQLYTKTVQAFPRTRKRQHATQPIQIVRTDFTPYIGTRNLLVRGQARSGTYTNVYYKPMLFFNEVEYIQGEQQPDQPGQPEQQQGAEGDMGEREAEVTEQANTVKIKATTGEEVTIVPIKLRDNIVRVRCDCLDFYYRFAPWNFSNDDIYGPKPKPYVRKTNHYPPANPSRSPGICKHVMKLTQACQEAGIVSR